MNLTLGRQEFQVRQVLASLKLTCPHKHVTQAAGVVQCSDCLEMVGVA